MYQVDFCALVGIWLVKQETPARLKQMTRHFNVMMGKVQQKLFETLQCICAWVHAKFRQLAYKANNFHFCLDINLILNNNK